MTQAVPFASCRCLFASLKHSRATDRCRAPRPHATSSWVRTASRGVKLDDASDANDATAGVIGAGQMDHDNAAIARDRAAAPDLLPTSSSTWAIDRRSLPDKCKWGVIGIRIR